MGGRGASYDLAGQVVGLYALEGTRESKKNIVDFFKYIDKNGGIDVDAAARKISTSKAAREKVDALADKLSRKIYERDRQSEEDYKDLKAALKGTYTISKQDRSNIPDYQSYIKSNRYIKIGKTGTSLDTKYQELSRQYPQYFHGATNPGDQLMQINRVMKQLKSGQKLKISDTDRAYTKKELKNDLIRAYAARSMGRKKKRA